MGFGFLAFDQFADGQKGAFVCRLLRERKFLGIERLELTPEQAQVLNKVANAVNIPYDPKERVFDFATVENKLPDTVEIPAIYYS